MRKSLTMVGIACSGLYLLVLGLVVLNTWTEARAMPLNNWGDFFSGAFAPLAFLWLVLGYLQQGKELQLNTQALKLQAEQLRHQVEETKLLVQEAAAQTRASTQLAENQAAEFELQSRRALPRFEGLKVLRWPASDESRKNAVWVECANVGSTITSISLLNLGEVVQQAIADPAAMLATSEIVHFRFLFRDLAPGNFTFEVHYVDGNAVQRVSEFYVVGTSCMLTRHGARPGS